MPSTFAWLDQSEEQRRRVLDVIDMFKEQGTVDELGLGTVRDALADILFPGTSNLMTRAAYYLFVPWMYQKLERQRTPAGEMGVKGRREELKLVERLLECGETEGVIGRRARGSLRRLPSSLYWAGMKRLAICHFDGSQEDYHRGADRLYGLRRATAKTDDGDYTETLRGTWNAKLPAPPEDWPRRASLTLSRDQAEFLRDQISLCAPDSLFALLTRASSAPSGVEYPWAHPQRTAFSERIVWQLDHAQNLSEIMHGAALLYNLILSELTANDELIRHYQSKLVEWAGMLHGRMSVLQRWNRRDAWVCLESEGARVPRPTHDFVDQWCDITLAENIDAIRDNYRARVLVINREKRLKGPLARVQNTRAQELWQGASSARRLQYRWGNASVIVKDIVTTLHGRDDA